MVLHQHMVTYPALIRTTTLTLRVINGVRIKVTVRVWSMDGKSPPRIKSTRMPVGGFYYGTHFKLSKFHVGDQRTLAKFFWWTVRELMVDQISSAADNVPKYSNYWRRCF